LMRTLPQRQERLSIGVSYQENRSADSGRSAFRHKRSCPIEVNPCGIPAWDTSSVPLGLPWASGNGGVLGVWTRLEQSGSEMHFRFRCYRPPPNIAESQAKGSEGNNRTGSPALIKPIQ
jgi:hypothetical protein